MDGALEFDEQGRESNSNKANNGFHNKIAPAAGGRFSLPTFFVRTKKVGRHSVAKQINKRNGFPFPGE